jgi:hypothetical protein
MKHTPEPWAYDIDPTDKAIIVYHECDENCPTIPEADICPEKGSIIIVDGEYLSAEAAERLCACVNACAGINPEAVPMMREALEKIVNSGTWFSSALEFDMVPDIDGPALEKLARAALAKLEES